MPGVASRTLRHFDGRLGLEALVTAPEHDVDRAVDRVHPVEGGGAAVEDFDPLDGRHGERLQGVHVPRIRNGAAVDEEDGPPGAERGNRAEAEAVEVPPAEEEVVDVLDADERDVRPVDHGDRAHRGRSEGGTRLRSGGFAGGALVLCRDTGGGRDERQDKDRNETLRRVARAGCAAETAAKSHGIHRRSPPRESEGAARRSHRRGCVRTANSGPPVASAASPTMGIFTGISFLWKETEDEIHYNEIVLRFPAASGTEPGRPVPWGARPANRRAGAPVCGGLATWARRAPRGRGGKPGGRGLPGPSSPGTRPGQPGGAEGSGEPARSSQRLTMRQKSSAVISAS